MNVVQEAKVLTTQLLVNLELSYFEFSQKNKGNIYGNYQRNGEGPFSSRNANKQNYYHIIAALSSEPEARRGNIV